MKAKELKRAIKRAEIILAYTLLYGIPEENNKDGDYLQVTKKDLLSVIKKAEKDTDFNVDLRDNYLYIN